MRDARARCAPAFVKPAHTCEVGEFGQVGVIANHRFYYVRYEFKPPPDDALYPLAYQRILIFELLSPTTLGPVLISGDDAAFRYGKPGIVRSAGRILLRIPASESGTGNFNREILCAWAANGWHDVDVTSWLSDLKHQLPKGLGAWKGIYPDWRKMTADTPLWREDTDGNCCPTGGQARIELTWQGENVALKRIHIERGKNGN